MFLNKARYKKTQDKLTTQFNIKPTPFIKNLKVKIEVTNSAYEAFITIPFNMEKTEVDLFKIIAFPQYKDDKTYFPIVEHTIFAQPTTNQNEFTPISQNRLMCIYG